MWGLINYTNSLWGLLVIGLYGFIAVAGAIFIIIGITFGMEVLKDKYEGNPSYVEIRLFLGVIVAMTVMIIMAYLAN